MRKPVYILLCILPLMFNSAFCTDIYWTGNDGDDDWFNPLNWSPQQVPGATDTVHFQNPPNGNITVEIDNGNATCYNLFLSGSGYTLEVTGNSELHVMNNLSCAAGNILYNRAAVTVEGILEMAGFLDNNFGSYLEINGKLLVQASGLVKTTGNAVNASNIITYNMENHGMIENEDMSEITVTNQLINHGDISNFNFANLTAQQTFINNGTLHNHKKTSLFMGVLFENHGTYISEDKAVLQGSGTLDIFNYGLIQNIDQSDFIDIKNIFNFDSLSNQDKGGFYVVQVIENYGTFDNDFYVEVGQNYHNFTGSSLLNTDEISCTGTFYNDGFVDNQSILTIDIDLQVDVNGSVANSGCFTVNGNILIDGFYTGTLLNYGTISGSGSYTFNRNTETSGIPFENEGWHYISTPVAGMSCHDIYDYWINDWDETINYWYNYSPSGTPCVAGPDNPFNKMKGYSIKRDLAYACGAVNPGTGAVIEFTGIAAGTGTGDQFIEVTGSGHEPGDPNLMNNWNLLGNPYPSAIDAGQIIFPPEIDNAIYYYNDATLSYESSVGGVGQPFIPVAQGFFVHVNTNGTYTFNLDNSVRTCNGDGIWYKSGITDLLEVEVHDNNGLSDKTYVRKLSEATATFDKQWDAYKLLSSVQEVPQLYSLVNGTRYSINAFDQSKMIPLVFRSGESNTYTLAVSGTNDFENVWLEDKTTGVLHNLKTGHSFSFTASAGDHDIRFVIHFTEKPAETVAEEIVIYSKGNVICINNQHNYRGEVKIMNLLGQHITSRQLMNGLNTLSIDRPAGFYFVQISTPDLSLSKKVYCN